METACKIFVGLALIGAAVICYGASELVLTYRCSKAPEPIPLRALLDRGEGTNRYVSVTEYEVGETALEMSNADQSSLSKWVYVPIFVKGGDPKNALILKMFHFTAMFSFDKREPVDGLVEDNWLSDEAKTKLADRYPGTDIHSARILSVGAKPSSLEFGWGLVAFGATFALPLCGLACWVAGGRSRKRRPRTAAGLVVAENPPPQTPTEDKP